MRSIPQFTPVVAAALLLSLLAPKGVADTELKGSPSELANYLAALPKMVAVSGEAESKVQADRGIVSLRVVTENKSLQEALRQNQEVRARIINSLKERGIKSDRIQPSRFSSTPKYGLFSEKAKSHRVENMIKVTVQDEKEFQAAAGMADGFSEVHYLGVDFEVSNKETLKTKVIMQALANAAERKKVYEENLGVRLLPRSFSEQTYSGSGAHHLPAETPKIVGGSAPQRVTPIPGRAASDVVEEPGSSFGEHVFRAQVTIEYAVETK